MIKRGLIGLLFILAFVITIPSLYVKAAYDNTPPVIEEIKILTPVVAQGGHVKIQMEISDDLSGVKDAGLIFDSPSGNTEFIPILLVSEHESLVGTYIFDSKKLSDYAEFGDWKLVYVSVKDYANNTRSYSLSKPGDVVIQNVSFNVVGKDTSIEDPIVNDGFAALEAKQDVQLNKEFTITFNMDIDISTILERNIYVLDRQGSRMPLLFIIDRGQDLVTSKVTIAPVGVYRADSLYTLYIKDVKSTTGQILSQNTKMNFTTQK